MADLEACIRDVAELIASSYHEWSDRWRCRDVSSKNGAQVQLMRRVLDPMRQTHGYPGALWCAMWTVRMGYEPYYQHWRDAYLCPWEPDTCQEDALGANGDEALGVPATWGTTMSEGVDGNDNRGEPDPRTMSCGLCGHLERTFGRAQFHLPLPPDYNTPRLQAHRASGNTQAWALGKLVHGRWGGMNGICTPLVPRARLSPMIEFESDDA